MDFNSIYELLINSKPLPYETYKSLVEAAEFGIDALEALAQGAITAEFPVVGNVIVWLAGSTLKWMAAEIIGLLPHEPSPEEKARMEEGRERVAHVKALRDNAVAQLAYIMSGEISQRRGKTAALGNITGSKKMAEILAPTGEDRMYPLAPAPVVNAGFQKAPIPRAQVPVFIVKNAQFSTIPQVARAGYRAPNIAVNRVGF